MYLHEPCYDLDELFRANLHIHTKPESRCASPEMVLPDIIRTAEKAGLTEIAITNHIHPGEEEKCVPGAKRLRAILAETPHDIKVYIGAELSAYDVDKFTFSDEKVPLDFRLYAHNHYHMSGWAQPDDRSPAGYKNHCRQVLEAILKTGIADAMAHPFTDYYIVREFEEEYGFTLSCVTDLWTDNELGDILTLGKENGTAWELNTSVLPKYPDFARRYFHIGKEVGACFTAGSDAHRLCDIDILSKRDIFRKLFDI